MAPPHEPILNLDFRGKGPRPLFGLVLWATECVYMYATKAYFRRPGGIDQRAKLKTGKFGMKLGVKVAPPSNYGQFNHIEKWRLSNNFP